MSMTSTMSDDSRASHYSVRRDSDAGPARAKGGLRLPFGAWGVAGVGAVALGLVGLLIPTATLEAVSFQLYLDQITAAALPPLGTTAHFAAALVLALAGGLVGYLLARLFGVSASGFSLRGLIDRMRGVESADEADAPTLRAADRHPDAPARRPFSAARDIPLNPAHVRAGEAGSLPPLYVDDGVGDDDDELLLDSMFIGDDAEPSSPFQPVGAAPLRGTSFDDVWADLPPPPPVIDPQPSSFVESDEVSLPAPSMEDWEQDVVPASARIAPVPFVAPVPIERPAPPPFTDPVIAPAPQHDVARTPDAPALTSTDPAHPFAPTRPASPPVEPLDLSVARLDDLLARLESGLGRRGSARPATPSADSVSSLTGVDVAPQGRPVPSPQAEWIVPADAPAAPQGQTAAPVMDPPATPAAGAADDLADPAFPHDPALAAALKTLRRLNQRATA